MLACTAAKPFDSPDYLYEVKWDGYRCLALVAGGAHRLHSRRLRDLSDRYPELAGLPRWVRGHQAVLDGELVALREGRPDFHALQERCGKVSYVVFDLLNLDGRDLTAWPLEARREALRGLVAEAERLVFSDHVLEHGRAFYRAVTARGLEGMVAKRLGSPYLPGQRSPHWLKVRSLRVVEAVVVGYLGGPAGVRSLVLGTPRQDGLRYAGRVASGLSARRGRELLGRLRPRASCPLVDPERLPSDLRAGVRWAEPEVRCLVECLEVTSAGVLRHPVYRGPVTDR